MFFNVIIFINYELISSVSKIDETISFICLSGVYGECTIYEFYSDWKFVLGIILVHLKTFRYLWSIIIYSSFRVILCIVVLGKNFTGGGFPSPYPEFVEAMLDIIDIILNWTRAFRNSILISTTTLNLHYSSVVHSF